MVTFLAVGLVGCTGGRDNDKTAEQIGSSAQSAASPAARPAARPAAAPKQLDADSDSRSITSPVVGSPEAVEMPEGYVGTAVCARCHSDRHESFLKTHHSRSLRRPTAADNPTGMAFHHPASHRSYTVKRAGELFLHREERYFGNSPDTTDRMPIAELPVEFVMGSGAFAKAYLVRDGNYLLQSPITWYTSKKAYEIAPGYDTPIQNGFGRVIEDSCVYCHAGLASVKGNNPNTFVLHELSIGCERCHGPGKQHAELYRDTGDASPVPSLADKKIVNPSALDRKLAESICAQCHLDSEVTIFAVGQDVWDFQPGQDLTLNRLAYKATRVTDSADEAKTFSNHFDQMWHSECYLQSETLTCVSCHDPHDSDPPTDRIAAFRKVCQSCHSEHPCTMPLDQREHQNQNACTACHMPRAPSDVPHASITSHLIAVYQDGKPNNIHIDNNDQLRRITTSTGSLTPQELKRRDTMARTAWAVMKTRSGEFDPLINLDDTPLQSLPSADEVETLALLTQATRQRAEGIEISQPKTPATIQEVKQQRDLSQVYATQTLAKETEPTKTRQETLETLADKMMIDQAFDRAIPMYEELVQIRRNSKDWYNLAICLIQVRRLGDAEAALQQAIDIDGAYAKAYATLAKIYSYVDANTAAQLQQIAAKLSGQR
ncbi:MAG: hypothetical protein KDB00_27340 [Planctomycetales bacterium]|nr:hypothetical protein [Planctomycetales bacterium]